MLTELLKNLSSEQKRILRDGGIRDQRRSDWTTGRRRPSEGEALILETVAGLTGHELLAWLAAEKASPRQRAWLERASGELWRRAGEITKITALVAIAFTATGYAQPAWSLGAKHDNV